ncbi:hypothetical protein PtA15_6A394 [Puccinia triticina]|uniref:Uncharacterized protein n=1 Tax=Puccinia triticina TaxID=208348 RepID=A0ABY7CL01_9BASI|nr:uncharacterized protein PtA15_6A394 [Puccinia triticina]WAQ85765.1 hypothetical protein PtA15_6A394 [Puccinia triticina]
MPTLVSYWAVVASIPMTDYPLLLHPCQKCFQSDKHLGNNQSPQQQPGARLESATPRNYLSDAASSEAYRTP